MRKHHRFYRPDGAPAGTDPAATSQADPAAKPEDGTAAAVADKTYTQEQVNGITAKEAAKAQAKLLKELGVTELKDVKEGLEALRRLQDEQKSDLEKAQGDAEKARKERDGLTEQLKAANDKLTALSKGVPADRVDKYIKLAEAYQTSDNALEDALEAALKDFPLQAATITGAVPADAGGQTAPADAWKPAADGGLSLNPLFKQM